MTDSKFKLVLAEFKKLRTYEHTLVSTMLMLIVWSFFKFIMGFVAAPWIGFMMVMFGFYMREIANYQDQNFDCERTYQPLLPALNPLNWTPHDQSQTYLVWAVAIVQLIVLNSI